MFGQLSERFESALRRLSGESHLSEANVREAMEDVRTALLEADVHYDVVASFCERVQQEALGEAVLKAVKPGEQMIKIVNDELVRLLGGDEALEAGEEAVDPSQAPPPIMEVVPGPTVVMMSGLQGSGKTTTCGKLAAYYKKRGKKVLLAAADLQRPAAVTQLRVLADQVQNDVEGAGSVACYAEPEKVAEYGKAVGAAVTVCKNALARAKRDEVDILILDTAGRLHVNAELMGELRQVAGAVTPHQILLVIDAMTGQDAVNSAKAFDEQLEIDGVVLTKYDSDTRGGAALSVRQVTGRPIKFVGVGEKLDALEAFHPTRVAGRILGMGDVVSLVEKAQEQVSEEEALALQEKMAKGQMTMDDFLGQLRAIRRMGSFKSLLGMLPGVGQAIKDLPIEEKQIDRTEAIIQSMNREERKGRAALDNSRRRRISRGSGTQAEDVSQLVKGFEMVSQMGKAMSGMGMLSKAKSMAGMSPDAAMASMGGMPGMPKRKGSTRSESVKKKFKQRKRRK
ncbi:signal recognition particle protein [Mucisphaera calidilacus]|uniref:Signal recognition particle protein n=1 Tax=Mucisphaera calidilacus TaxID=2527982 RepID=A0A518BTC4_9BACT|nr:signal recognition particle protein [Mucisphaera calidilacus]QDU70226.1 Signal recognition particle protein [Mucisphaera calidilacus]